MERRIAVLLISQRRFIHATSSVYCSPKPEQKSIIIGENNKPNFLWTKLERFLNVFEDVSGLTEVKKAQDEVMQAEEKLSQTQLKRRQKQHEVKQIQSRIKDIHLELDRTQRGDDKYLFLLTEEHALIKQEKTITDEFELYENAEREAFHTLRNKTRYSHEKERERGERTKYWSLMGSLAGAIIGMLGASLSNELRMRRIKEMIPTSQEVRPLLEKINDLVHNEQTQISQFVTEIKDVLRVDNPKLASLKLKKPDVDDEKVLNVIQNQHTELSSQLAELKRLIALEQTLQANPNAVVYVGDDMERLLDESEKRLESKMKLQTLLTVVFVYGVVGITAPIIYLWFTGKL